MSLQPGHEIVAALHRAMRSKYSAVLLWLKRCGTATRMVIYDVNQTGQPPTVNQREQSDLLTRLRQPQNKKGTLSGVMASGSVQYSVSLTKTKQTVVDTINDGSLKILGVRDGQGASFVGVLAKTGEKLISPVMGIGEIIELPFAKLNI